MDGLCRDWLMISISEAAPAKINLTLKVLGRRADGYHALESLVVFARDVADEVTLSAPADPERDPVIVFDGPFATQLNQAVDTDTTISTAWRLLSARFPNLAVGDVEIYKQIPLASGLGGGSADAGALLRAIARCNPDQYDQAAWLDIARNVGADGPVCFKSQAQMMSGAGEVLKPIEEFPELFAVLINTLETPPPNKTERIFAALNAPPARGASTVAQARCTNPVPDLHSLDDVAMFVRAHGNDLLQPACSVMPAIDAPLAALARTQDCLIASMSGAGPTVFGLFATRSAADAAARDLARVMPTCWVRATHLG